MLNYEQAYDELKSRIKKVVDKTFNPTMQITMRGASNQKPSNPYIQLWFRNWDKIGNYFVDPLDSNKTAIKYEVSVDISVHRPPSSTSTQGSTTIALNKLIHSYTAKAATYLDSYNDTDISFLRVGSVSMRHFPIDKVQMEERSSAMFVFEVVVVETDTQDVGYIDTVQLSTTAYSDQQQIENNETIIYPQQES